MPIRIKPVHDLGPCVLTLESIEDICELVEQYFNNAQFSAEDDVWEVYNEPKDGFISAITPRETLDSFTAKAKHQVEVTRGNKVISVTSMESERVLELIFDRYQATAKFSGPYEQENLFNHFTFDLRRCLKPPRFRQRIFLPDKGMGNYGSIGFPAIGKFSMGVTESIITYAMKAGKAPYCLIILHDKPPSAFLENIKANILSNIIWTLLVFIVGFGFAFFVLWMYRTYGININDVLTPPVIPTITPTP